MGCSAAAVPRMMQASTAQRQYRLSAQSLSSRSLSLDCNCAKRCNPFAHVLKAHAAGQSKLSPQWPSWREPITCHSMLSWTHTARPACLTGCARSRCRNSPQTHLMRRLCASHGCARWASNVRSSRRAKHNPSLLELDERLLNTRMCGDRQVRRQAGAQEGCSVAVSHLSRGHEFLISNVFNESAPANRIEERTRTSLTRRCTECHTPRVDRIGHLVGYCQCCSRVGQPGLARKQSVRTKRTQIGAAGRWERPAP